MFNCYCVYVSGIPYAYFKFELTAEGFVQRLNDHASHSLETRIEGKYIPGIEF